MPSGNTPCANVPCALFVKVMMQHSVNVNTAASASVLLQ